MAIWHSPLNITASQKKGAYFNILYSTIRFIVVNNKKGYSYNHGVIIRLKDIQIAEIGLRNFLTLWFD